MTLFAVLFAACHKDDDETPTPGEQPAQSSDNVVEIMAVFVPCQLGDMGYADAVMEGLNVIKSIYKMGEDSTNVRFLSPWDEEDMKESVKAWAQDTVSHILSQTYARRLLVLTDPILASVLDTIKNDLRECDDVLILKTSEADIDSIALKHNLGDRIHGLNISAAYSIRRYCQFMGSVVKVQKQLYDRDVSTDKITIVRLYDQDAVNYRDSIEETIREVFGDKVEIENNYSHYDLSTEWFSSNVKLAYVYSEVLQSMYEMGESPFVIFDLGAANAGVDYWLLGRDFDGSTFYPLIIDGNESYLAGRSHVRRQFGDALASWMGAWINSDTRLDKMTQYSGAEYCKDDLSFIDIDFKLDE